MYYLTEFGSLKKRSNEYVIEFNKIFNKLYNKIPRDIKHSQSTTKVTYDEAFDDDFTMVLMERKSPILLVMQVGAIEIEGNMIALGKMRQKKDQVERKKAREYCGTSDSNKDSQDARIEEMSRLIINLTNKMSRFEIENNNANKAPREGGMINPNQFRGPFNPQLMKRERRNEEQPIQPLVKTNNDNNLVEEVMDEEYIEYTEEVHLLKDENNAIHITQNDYESSLNPRKHIPKNI